MKLFARPKCFSEALRLVTILSCLLGFRAFEYPRGYSRPILSFIYFLFMYGTFYSGAFRIQEKFYANNVKMLRMEYVLYQLLSHLFIVSIIFKMFLGWWHTKKFKVCYKKIFEIDKTLRQLGLSVNYDRLYFVTIGIITVWITTAFIISTMLFVQLQIHTNIFTSIYIILVHMYALITIGINTFEFCIFVKYLEIKFKLVNQLLSENLTNLSTKEIKLGVFELTEKDYANTKKRKHILSMKMIFRRRRRVQQIHLELCKISKIVCTVFGIQIAWEIGEIIMFLIGALYNLYVRFIIQQYKVKNWANQTTFALAICFLCIVKAVPLSRICKYAAVEGNKTIEIIHAINGCDANTNIQEEVCFCYTIKLYIYRMFKGVKTLDLPGKMTFFKEMFRTKVLRYKKIYL
ncbi:hypothetical protein ALC57_01723 [Trachymyrmex cornetzi]|uniref:Gustatory receptor n=1 Tax=Trachymyrmex cornetzi TaxID=471704 RepID=A0A195EKG6_9HYME|nr:hypothetical protein ALC57_01723 [Trachymyrmex cornetzi]